MTYCLAMKVEDGLVCVADGRITSGRQLSNARKVSLHGPDAQPFCVMTSGLRSLRDKTLAYLDRETGTQTGGGPQSLLDAVDAYTKCLRRVAKEDRSALEASDLPFDLHALIAGRLAGDQTATVFLVYPEGNWIEIDERTPHLSIGNTAYGKPILDRALKPETSIRTALKLAYLSFDSCRTSSADVGFPIDMLVLPGGGQQWRQVHFEYDDLLQQRVWWNEHITKLADEMPDGPWAESLLPHGGSDHLTLVADD